MIITLTANPSLDRTVTLPGELVPGGVHRIATDITGPGGKGINVALGVLRAGLDVLAIFPASPADPLVGLIDALSLPHRETPTSGRVRTNLTVLSEPGLTTKINEPGATLDAGEVEAMEDVLVSAVSEGDIVMLSGSLAPGIPSDEYARLVPLLRARGAWVGVDTSDDPLLALAAAAPQGAPDFLKPNAEELGQLTGGDGVQLEAAARAGDLSAVRDAARDLHDSGVGDVLVTLGGAGAVLVTDEGAWFAPSPDAPVVSTVGAGDSAVAGYLIAKSQDASPQERLALAVAYGAVAVSLSGTTIPARADVHEDASTVTEI